jgi:hypothetical protein
MSNATQQNERRFSPASLSRMRSGGPSAMLLGGTCVVLGVLCLGVTFWNGDLAVQSGAVLLGVSLGASGIIAFLAGDR